MKNMQTCMNLTNSKLPTLALMSQFLQNQDEIMVYSQNMDMHVRNYELQPHNFNIYIHACNN